MNSSLKTLCFIFLTFQFNLAWSMNITSRCIGNNEVYEVFKSSLANKKLEVVKFILDNCEDRDILLALEDANGFPPLISALPDTKLTELLLEYGADPNQKSKNGSSAVRNAVSRNYLASLKVLINAGANVKEDMDDEGNNLLICSGELSMMQYLLNLGVSLNHSNNSEVTPLMNFSASINHSAIVKFLLVKGANPNLVNVHGQTALMKIATLGISYTKKNSYGSSSSINAQNEQLALIEALIKAKANPSIKDRNGKTAKDLYLATLNANSRNVKRPHILHKEAIIKLLQDI